MSLRIALVDYSTDVWTASGSFLKMLGLSLAAAIAREGGAEAGVLTRGSLRVPGLPVWPWEKSRESFLESVSRRAGLRVRKSELMESAGSHGANVLLPVFDLRHAAKDMATIGWVPDLQYRHLPQYFSEATLRDREGQTARLARHCTRILLSSQSARADFVAAEPAAETKMHVVPFPSLFAFEELGAPDTGIAARYHLPEKFALVANQFWAHKNHLAVVEAARILRDRGVEVPIVFTGLPLDVRDPANKTVSEVLQAIAKAGLQGRVIMLGAVPFSDLIALLRASAVIIQPSRFEGWSTTVQDAKALGRPVIASEISVHREQSPDALGFFPCDAPEALVEVLATQWPALAAGPSPTHEAAALQRERAFAAGHGASLLALCREAAAAI